MRIPGSDARWALRLLGAPARSAHARVDGNAAAVRRRVTLMPTRGVPAFRRNRHRAARKAGAATGGESDSGVLRDSGYPLNMARGWSDA